MLKDKLESLIKESMKNKDDIRTNVLRLIKNEFLKKEKDGSGEYNETIEEKILSKMVSQHEESISQFNSNGRMDLAEKEIAELNVIKEFAPKEASENDIIALTEEIITDIISTSGEGFKISMKDMKTVLSRVQATYPTANGAIVSKVLKTHI